jgi:hypothetical protein
MTDLSPWQLIAAAICIPVLVSSVAAWVISLGHDLARKPPHVRHRGDSDG